MKTVSLSTATVNACSCFMKSSQLRLLTVLGAALVALAPLRPARAVDNNPPTKLTHQGFLTDANGLPLGNAAPVNKSIIFRIFAAPAAGTPLWAAQQVVTVDKGHYSVLLGEGSAMGSEPFLADLSTIFTGTGASDRFLEITVDGAALSPRLQFLPAPFAMLARKAMTVDSTAILLPAQVSGTLAASQIPSLDASKITTGFLDAARIPDTVLRTTGDQTVAGKLTVLKSGGIDLSSDDSLLNARVIANRTGTLDKDLYIGHFSGTGAKVRLYSHDVETMTVTGGKVGIGTNTPAKTLDVAGYARIKDHLIFNSTDAVINWGGSGKLYFRGNNTIGDEGTFTRKEHMVITSVGNVGIGTVSPVAPLHVKRRGTEALNTRKLGSDLTYGVYLGLDGNVFATSQSTGQGLPNNGLAFGDDTTVASGTLAAVFEGNIVVQSHIWVGDALQYSSDRRAKNVVGLSQSAADLEGLLKLRVTDYNWIDRSKDGHRPHKQLIAQEVEEVFPQAVTTSPLPQVIPSVYEMASAVEHDAVTRSLRVTTKKAHGFQVGDKVDLYGDATELKEVVVKSVISANQFTVASEKPMKSCFVYGKQVKDFRTVDYDAIFMLNVSATQELARQNKTLQKRVDELESRERQVVTLQKRVTELEGLERQVADLQKLVRQVAERQSPSPRAALSENGADAVLPVSTR